MICNQFMLTPTHTSMSIRVCAHTNLFGTPPETETETNFHHFLDPKVQGLKLCFPTGGAILGLLQERANFEAEPWVPLFQKGR